MSECRTIRAKGIDNVLLVTGEHKSKVGIDYFRRYVPLILQAFSSLMMKGVERLSPLSASEATFILRAQRKNLSLRSGFFFASDERQCRQSVVVAA
ncbi:hypothetical protein [Sodalis-like endosymbiont of Proechinophthirus fluctus]|uniref:hypothetical protein n=1 Tax=Sodalis-like endosymbiont of Proechinophthirus fluctus TaxID=1462730 RepID=UPI0008338540|nr:hypothetical protein [Sodalis-like endosymbiont of Proechinophthirus fluctus]